MSNIAFIAARMGSERMPGKVLSELAGIPALVHIFNIMKQARLVDDFIVVTTVLKEDDDIEKICIKNSVKVLRGSVHDVLDRFRLASEKFKPQRIVRVTGDDPLMDPEIIDKVITAHTEGNYDYTSNMIERTYPRGMDTEVIEYSALKKTWRSTNDKDDHEHVTLYIRRNPQLFKSCSVVNDNERSDDLRLCLDTQKDLELMEIIYKNLYKGRVIKLDEVINFLNANPRLKEINSDIQQKTVKGKVY
ncbi:MAG: glycosyltransferase family protein [Ignavibacteria bacterium]